MVCPAEVAEVERVAVGIDLLAAHRITEYGGLHIQQYLEVTRGGEGGCPHVVEFVEVRQVEAGVAGGFDAAAVVASDEGDVAFGFDQAAEGFAVAQLPAMAGKAPGLVDFVQGLRCAIGGVGEGTGGGDGNVCTSGDVGVEVVEGVAVYVDIAACHHLPQYAVVVEHVGNQGFLDLVACTCDRADGVPLAADAGETGKHGLNCQLEG